MPYFINKLKQRIAYKTVNGRGPGIIFIHGLNSDMNGKKALTIEKYAKKIKQTKFSKSKFPESFEDDPNCLVHCFSASELYLTRKIS